MSLGMKNKKEYLDAKRCFQLWYETSSLYKTREIFIREGIRNPKTNKPPTVMGIWYAAWIWGLANLDEAKKMVTDVYRSHGELLTDAEWKEIIIPKAKYLLSTKKYQKFVEEHGL